MVDMVHFLICLAMYSLSLIFAGWLLGEADAKKKYEKKGQC
jgi:hypothetical protein